MKEGARKGFSGVPFNSLQPGAWDPGDEGFGVLPEGGRQEPLDGKWTWNMWKKEARRNIDLFIKVGLPYTVGGVVVVLAGIYALKRLFAGSDYLSAILLLWLAVFWFLYQPLFRKRVKHAAAERAKQWQRPGDA